jgi:hypothetical protein
MILTAMMFLIMVVIGIKTYFVGRYVEDIENDIKSKKLDVVVCKKSKLLLRKEDAYKVKVIEEAYGIYGNYSYLEDCEYYSPLYAPEYDCVDKTFTPHKYTKTVKESQVEVKVPKSK